MSENAADLRIMAREKMELHTPLPARFQERRVNLPLQKEFCIMVSTVYYARSRSTVYNYGSG